MNIAQTTADMQQKIFSNRGVGIIRFNIVCSSSVYYSTENSLNEHSNTKRCLHNSFVLDCFIIKNVIASVIS